MTANVVAPEIGLDSSGAVPRNHWNARGLVPLADVCRLTGSPALIVAADAEATTFDGGTHEEAILIVTVRVSRVPHALVSRAQKFVGAVIAGVVNDVPVRKRIASSAMFRKSRSFRERRASNAANRCQEKPRHSLRECAE